MEIRDEFVDHNVPIEHTNLSCSKTNSHCWSCSKANLHSGCNQQKQRAGTMISKIVMEQTPVDEMFRHKTDQRIINEDFCSMLVYPCQHRETHRIPNHMPCVK